MLKIGIIGLGDIARKAYLPVISRKKVELHLCSRNERTLAEVGDEYRIKNLHQTIQSLIATGIEGAFVHTSTDSHFNIIEELLSNNIHVYVDKPLTSDYASSEKLISLAVKKNLVLMVGFNRRYAPSYQMLKEMQNPNMIIMQKNRNDLPGEVRKFIFDDFIHVVDTLLYLFPYKIQDIIINGKMENDLLKHVVVQFISSEGNIAMGIMNRDSGTVEEKLEVFTSTQKKTVCNLSETFTSEQKTETKSGVDDWEPTLHKRGFNSIVDAFLSVIRLEKKPLQSAEEILYTHKICEQIVTTLKSN